MEKEKKIGLFNFYAILASMILAVYEYPAFATSKLQLVFYLILAAVLLFVPLSFCTAEMASISEWREDGGIYEWVSQTIGKLYGFIVVIFQWTAVSFGYVILLYFMIGSISQAFSWSIIDHNKWIKFFLASGLFWGLSLLQFLGTRFTTKLVKYCFIMGILFPTVFMFLLSIFYVFKGGKTYINFTLENFFPKSMNLVFVSFVLSYVGVEASATYINRLKNAKRNYPLSIILLIITAVLFHSIGGLSIALVVPQKALSLDGGMVEALKYMTLAVFPNDSAWIVIVLTIIICFGVVGSLSAWIVGPSRGILFAAKDKNFPHFISKTNSKDVPVNILLIQAVLVNCWIGITLLGDRTGSNNIPYLIAITINCVIYLTAYIFLFLGYIILITKKSDIVPKFNVTNKKNYKLIVGFLGLFGTILSLIVSFIPPKEVVNKEKIFFFWLLFSIYIFLIIVPVIFYKFYSMKKQKESK